MALTGALCQTLLAATGFTNKNLRVLIPGCTAVGCGAPNHRSGATTAMGGSDARAPGRHGPTGLLLARAVAASLIR